MADTLEEARQRVKRAFLGRRGVHAVGLRTASGAVAVYVDTADSADTADAAAASAAGGEPADLLAALRAAAAPFDVVLVASGKARLAAEATEAGEDGEGSGRDPGRDRGR